jgi:hypothetical protein
VTSILNPKSPLARLFLGVGLAGVFASAALTWAFLKLGSGGPIDRYVALVALVLLPLQAVPASGLLAWAKLRDERRRFAVERSPWIPVAGAAGIIGLGFLATPMIASLTGVVASTMFLSTRLARGKRGWIIAWILLCVPVFLADAGAAWAWWWWKH